VSKLKRPAVRWAIAFLFLVVELLLFVVLPEPGNEGRYEITPTSQAVLIALSLVMFAIIPSILKEYAETDIP
jgi:hypothetical protein